MRTTRQKAKSRAKTQEKRGLRRQLDEGILRHLRRVGPSSIWSVNAYAELHKDHEVLASLRRLKAKGLVESVQEPLRGWLWRVTENTCEAREEKNR